MSVYQRDISDQTDDPSSRIDYYHCDGSGAAAGGCVNFLTGPMKPRNEPSQAAAGENFFLLCLGSFFGTAL